MLTTSPTWAKPIDAFCLIQTWTNKKIEPNDEYWASNYKFLSFTAAGKLFSLNLTNGPYIELRKQDRTLLKVIQFLQPAGLIQGSLLDIKISQKGWLLVRGMVKDYLAHVDLHSAPPLISGPIELSSLLGDACLSLPIIGCGRATGIYSEALDRIFVSSTRNQLFGLMLPISYQIVDGVVKPLPKRLLKLARLDGSYSSNIIFQDLPLHHGVLFKDANTSEALFYNGKTVTSLLNTAFYGIKSTIIDVNRMWDVDIAALSKRAFLSINYQYPHQGKTDLFEIATNLELTQILLPEKIDTDSFMLVEFSKTGPIFWSGIHSQTINIEIKGKLITIIRAIKSSVLMDVKLVGESPNNAISFITYNPHTKEKRKYYIVRNSKSTQCLAAFDTDKPILLN
jgi:hypothetical protein